MPAGAARGQSSGATARRPSRGQRAPDPAHEQLWSASGHLQRRGASASAPTAASGPTLTGFDATSCKTSAGDAGEEPLPERRLLDAEIERTLREIAGLEEESLLLQQALHDERAAPKPAPGDAAASLPPLPPVEAPEPPKISRISREAWVDPKWDKARRELIDPLPLLRSYLDRTCRPPLSAPKPCWVPANTPGIAEPGSDFWEGSVETMTVDPVEQHIKNLCKPF